MDWEVLIHGSETALQMYNETKNPLHIGVGAGVGAGAVYMADSIMAQLMNNPDDKKTALQATATGVIEDTISALAVSLIAANPITWETVGLAALWGVPEGLIVHGLEGEIDWNAKWMGWN